ncbi:MAG: aminoacyl-tRNA hydrolase [Candidatus Shapirobacteria bacterium]|jgi:PTH1 family peptidyl-tRNA hydrolase
MKLFFGLGNPGKDYENTRHNLGQMVIKKYVETHDRASLLNKSKLQSQLCEINKNIFAVSTEYMNVSGTSVQKAAAFYKISPENIYIIHDDLDLPVGEWKLQFDRGPAGHNGVISTIENLGTQSFWRIRIGIGKPEFEAVESYVLKPFFGDEKVLISQTIDKISEEIEKILGS